MSPNAPHGVNKSARAPQNSRLGIDDSPDDSVHSPMPSGRARLRVFERSLQFQWPDGSTRPYALILFRDHHAWCPFCQKAWILLEELQLNYAVVKVTMHNYGEKEFWYEKYVHPRGTFPSLLVLEDDRGGKGKTGSKPFVSIINDSDNVLARLVQIGRISSPRRNSLRLEDRGLWDLQEPRIHWFCDSVEKRLGSGLRRWLSRLGESGKHEGKDDRYAAQLERDNRAIFLRECRRLEDGVRKAAAEDHRGDSAFLLGTFSIADIVAIPWLERSAAQLFYYKQGFNLRNSSEFPVLSRWFSAMDARVAYQGTKSCMFTHNHSVPHSIRPCYFDDLDGEKARACCGRAVRLVESSFDGWQSAVDNFGRTLEAPPDVDLAAYPCDIARHTTEAVTRVQKFLPVLAKKNPHGEQACLRVVGRVLACMLNAAQSENRPSRTSAVGRQPASQEGSIVEEECLALRYFRDRFNAPRDMSFHAARLLRGACFREMESCLEQLASSTGKYHGIEWKNRKDTDPKTFVGDRHWQELPPMLQGIF
eukprot:gnl/TRDRNA2_/TRDRNA2_29809_c0_seq2.p1 gnl/TRDRNA2_/TRDRNA2_29809_c0~~gnl/TRDRNA2_/TRDRNA2_29809_c0_seq2.p1  ORF type:complete len:543 (-),score=66.64 gnl/TRDRNA2_/TRDRNA2_29809_c0_seq2:28-1629(-)